VKVGIWCAVSARRIAGPVFFNERINCEGYVQVILRQFFSELTEEERLKFPAATPELKNQRKIFVGKLQIFLQNSFTR
jgi:hypothetical protein